MSPALLCRPRVPMSAIGTGLRRFPPRPASATRGIAQVIELVDSRLLHCMSPLMGWPGRAQRLICWTAAGRREATLKEHAMRTSQKTAGIITTIGIDLGKNTFHLVGFDQRGVIILQQKVSRAQLERRLANIPRCLIGMEACSGSHHIGRQLARDTHAHRGMRRAARDSRPKAPNGRT